MGEPKRRVGLTLTLIVTNVIKVGGLVLAFKGAFATHPSAVILALSGFMMAGAQFGEETIMALASRFFVHPVDSTEETEPPRRVRKRKEP